MQLKDKLASILFPIILAIALIALNELINFADPILTVLNNDVNINFYIISILFLYFLFWTYFTFINSAKVKYLIIGIVLIISSISLYFLYAYKKYPKVNTAAKNKNILITRNTSFKSQNILSNNNSYELNITESIYRNYLTLNRQHVLNENNDTLQSTFNLYYSDNKLKIKSQDDFNSLFHDSKYCAIISGNVLEEESKIYLLNSIFITDTTYVRILNTFRNTLKTNNISHPKDFYEFMKWICNPNEYLSILFDNIINLRHGLYRDFEVFSDLENFSFEKESLINISFISNFYSSPEIIYKYILLLDKWGYYEKNKNDKTISLSISKDIILLSKNIIYLLSQLPDDNLTQDINFKMHILMICAYFHNERISKLLPDSKAFEDWEDKLICMSKIMTLSFDNNKIDKNETKLIKILYWYSHILLFKDIQQTEKSFKKNIEELVNKHIKDPIVAFDSINNAQKLQEKLDTIMSYSNNL